MPESAGVVVIHHSWVERLIISILGGKAVMIGQLDYRVSTTTNSLALIGFFDGGTLYIISLT